MIQANDKDELRVVMRGYRSNSEVTAFVPTLGNLHEGHLSLVRKAREVADRVVVSIFVNPTQFDKAEDLAAYPRTLDNDLALLKKEKIDLVFLPQARERILGKATRQRFEKLQVNISEGRVKDSQKLMGEIAVTVCARCHNTHRIIYDLRNALLPD